MPIERVELRGSERRIPADSMLVGRRTRASRS